jgi:hypothetical protein
LFVLQSSYVICRVFQKEGPGPRNGAQYGKPFNEKDWDIEEEIDCVQAVPLAVVSAPAPILPGSRHISAANDMHPSARGWIGPTSLSRLMPSDLTQPSAPSNLVDDGILSMLAIIKDDNTLDGNENNESEACNLFLAHYTCYKLCQMLPNFGSP